MSERCVLVNTEHRSNTSELKNIDFSAINQFKYLITIKLHSHGTRQTADGKLDVI